VGELGVELDNGGNAPGAILQRLEDGEWTDFRIDGRRVVAPVDYHRLPPGRYRVVRPGGFAAR
jgi:hypothetical protein